MGEGVGNYYERRKLMQFALKAAKGDKKKAEKAVQWFIDQENERIPDLQEEIDRQFGELL